MNRRSRGGPAPFPDLGTKRNGHGLIYEKSSHETLQPVLRWLDEHVNLQADPEEVHA